MLLCGLAVLGAGTTARGDFLYFRNDRPGTFIDISATGTALTINNDEEVVLTTTLGNRILPAGRIVVGYNGGVAFGPTASDDLTDVNEPIDTATNTPNPNVFGGGRTVLPAHDNPGTRLMTNDSGVFIQELSDRVIIQYNNIPVGTQGETIRYQVQVFDPPLGVIPPPEECFAQFIYDVIDGPIANGGAIFTIGYQDGLGGTNNNVQWSFNTAGAVSNGTVLTFCTPAPGAAMVLGIGLAGAGRRCR